ncbi:MAG: TSUP family transporter [Hyphomicrobiales bacterium]|nr:TSUP family transporter [Hyphomicrobiales bacterium]
MLDAETLATLFAIAILAGCFDAIAGGGGLITVPALLLAGLPPLEVIATNKLQTTFGSTSSSLTFARRGLIEWRSAIPFALLAFAGSIAGALSVKLVPRPVLEAAVPVMLIIIASYFALSRRMTNEDAKAKVSPLLFGALIPPVVGFYDGIFGPGAGSFYMAGFVSLLGYGVVKATAHTKLANAGSNWGSLLVFMVSGSIVWTVGLIMGVGSLIGAQIGSRLAIRFGATLIRPLLVVICIAMTVRLLADPQNPLRVFAEQIL